VHLRSAPTTKEPAGAAAHIFTCDALQSFKRSRIDTRLSTTGLAQNNPPLH
jgi:hypothetical protein